MPAQPHDPLLDVTRHGGGTTARFRRAHLTEADAAALDRELAALAVDRDRPLLTLDLAAVSFLTSMALGRFAALARRVRAAGGRLALVNPSPHVREVFVVARLGRLLDAARTTAVDAVRARAYRRWEEAGRPAGDGVDFWYAAEREVCATG